MMNIMNRNQKILYSIIYSSMVFSIAYMFGLAIRVKLNIPLRILSIALVSQLVNLFLMNPLLLFYLFAIIFITFVIASSFFETYVNLFFERVFLLFTNIFNHLKGKENIASENRLIFWIMLIALMSIFTWLIVFKRKNIFVLLPVYISAFLYYWYNNYDSAYWMIALFLFLFLVLMGLNKYFEEKSDASKRFHVLNEYFYSEKVKTIIKYGFFAVVIAIMLPKSSYSVEWPWLDERVREIFPGIENLRSDDVSEKGKIRNNLFVFSRTGYNDEPSKLGGPIILDDTLVMTVYGNEPFYLRGNIKHTYTGSYWLSEARNWSEYRFGEDFSDLSEEEKEKYYNETSIKIINNSISTTALFSPYKPYAVDFDSKSTLQVSTDDALFFPQRMGIGKSYSVKVLKPLFYNQLVDLGIDRKKDDIEDISIYLQLPEKRISDSTRELVKEIVKDAETDLDKAIAIEEYLRKNYEYTFNVEKVPEGREFVDYFLFESRKGYCTYYATSMAVMLRLEGIPARYIEGYVARDSSVKGIYKVKNNNAHAWVEAFIEPVGWMTFDPTPAYPQIERFAEGPKDDLEENTEAIESERFADVNRERLQTMRMREMEADEGVGTNSNIKSQMFIKRVLEKLPIVVMSIAILGLFMRFLIGFIKVRYQDIRISKMPNREKVIYLYNEIIKLISLRGLNQEPGETHYEFANRVARYFYIFIEEKDIMQITDIFVRNKYGSFLASDEDVLTMEQYKKTLENRIRHYLGPINYFYKRYGRVGRKH